MNYIKSANTYVLKVLLANLGITFVTVLFDRYLAQVIIYTFLGFFCLKSANKGHIELPIHKPNIKKAFLCIAIMVTAFPMAESLNMLGIAISGESSTNIDISANMGVLFLTLAVLPSIVEEIAYRGLIQGAYMRESALYSILFSALAFAFIHFSINAMMYAFFYGCIFGLVRVLTNNLAYTIIMHMGFNIINIGLLYINDVGMVISGNGALAISGTVAIGILSTLACIVLLIVLLRTSGMSLAAHECAAKKFISKESLIAYAICICITLISQMFIS